MHDLLRWLAPVRNIELHAEHFRRVQLHRNNRIYAFLLHICEFVHEHWLPAEHGGARRFRDFVRDGLSTLFEDFVLNFYRHELPADWHASAPVIQWQFDAANADALALVPRMETDVCLCGPGRAIILDTKFYAQALKAGAYGTARLPSAISISSSLTCVSSPANPVGSRPRASSFTRAPHATSPSNSPHTATEFAL